MSWWVRFPGSAPHTLWRANRDSNCLRSYHRSNGSSHVFDSSPRLHRTAQSELESSCHTSPGSGARLRVDFRHCARFRLAPPRRPDRAGSHAVCRDALIHTPHCGSWRRDRRSIPSLAWLTGGRALCVTRCVWIRQGLLQFLWPIHRGTHAMRRTTSPVLPRCACNECRRAY